MNKCHLAKERNHDILRGACPISALVRIKMYFSALIFAALKVKIISHCWW